MIDCECNMCDARFRVPDKLAGRRLKCPYCKEPVTVPVLGSSLVQTTGVPARKPPHASQGCSAGALPYEEIMEALGLQGTEETPAAKRIAEPREESMTPKSSEPESVGEALPIGGWLLVYATYLVLGPVAALYALSQGFFGPAVILLPYWFFVIYAFFNRKRRTPALVSVLNTLFFLLSLGQLSALTLFIWLWVWTPYFIASKRVKATFVVPWGESGTI